MGNGTKTALVLGGLLVAGGSGYGIYKLLTRKQESGTDGQMQGLTYYGDHNTKVTQAYWNQQRFLENERRVVA